MDRECTKHGNRKEPALGRGLLGACDINAKTTGGKEERQDNGEERGHCREQRQRQFSPTPLNGVWRRETPSRSVTIPCARALFDNGLLFSPPFFVRPTPPTERLRRDGDRHPRPAASGPLSSLQPRFGRRRAVRRNPRTTKGQWRERKEWPGDKGAEKRKLRKSISVLSPSLSAPFLTQACKEHYGASEKKRSGVRYRKETFPSEAAFSPYRVYINVVDSWGMGIAPASIGYVGDSIMERIE